MPEQRKRFNAKQTAAGLWQLDVTVEVTAEAVDSKDQARETVAAIEALESEFVKAGKKIVETK
jgi:hypothetical protein